MTSCAQSMRESAIRGAISAVLSLHTDRSLPCPTFSPSLERIIKGVRSLPPLRPSALIPASERRLPLTHPQLLAIMGQFDPEGLEGALIRCSFSLLFYGLFRPGELVPRRPASPPPATLRLRHVVVRDSCVEILLLSSKTGQHAPTRVIVGPVPDLSCPVIALDQLLSVRDRLGIPSSPEAFLFQMRSGRPLSYGALTRALKQALAALHLPPDRYGLHSFRIGGASSLSAAGAPDHVIANAGRWRSDVFRRYCRPSSSEQAARAAMMALPRPSGLALGVAPSLRPDSGGTGRARELGMAVSLPRPFLAKPRT